MSFFISRRHIFGFCFFLFLPYFSLIGCLSFINLNRGLRENAAVSDMAAESQVGCVNYELKNTSNQSLDCVSSSNVKAQKLQFSKAIRVKIIVWFLPRQVH